MVRILIVAAIFIAGWIPALVEAHTDIALLRDVICSYETRGEANPDRARGTSDELGRCQIRPGTARWVGYRGSDRYLSHARINRHWSLKYLEFCKSKLGTDSVSRLAHAYVGGPYLPYEGYGKARRYAAQILKRYRAAQFQAVAARVFPWSRT